MRGKSGINDSTGGGVDLVTNLSSQADGLVFYNLALSAW